MMDSKSCPLLFFSSFGFNLKSGRGTRANLHKNGHKRIRKMFLNSGFESGTDLNKTRKWPLRFSPQLTYFSAQKRRMDFSGFMRGKLDKCVDGKLFLEFLGINWQTGGKGVTEPKENKSPKPPVGCLLSSQTAEKKRRIRF